MKNRCLSTLLNPPYFDALSVIFGSQGIRKTSLLEVLGSDLYRHLDGETSDKDTRMIASQGWIIEWGEIETAFGKKAVSKMKSFITERKDNYRPPYGKKLDILNEARKYCLWGTTNEQELLADPTGTRRFWMIHQAKKVEIDFVVNLRDEVWAEACAAYFAGEPWWLNADEEQWLEDNNREYLQTSVWDEDVQNFLHGKATNELFTINDIFNFLGFENVSKDDPKRNKIRNSLQRAGCVMKHRTYSGINAKWWWKPEKTDLPELHLPAVTGASQGGVTFQTPMVEPLVTGDTKIDEIFDINSPRPVKVPQLDDDDLNPFSEYKPEKSEILVSPVTNPDTKLVIAVTPPVTSPVTPESVTKDEGGSTVSQPLERVRLPHFPKSWEELLKKVSS